jgi:hypothetical protein
MLELSYRQTKRLLKHIGRRAKGLQHRSAEEVRTERSPKFRRKVLQLIRESIQERNRAVWAHAGGGTFRMRMGWQWARRRCGVGCWRRVWSRMRRRKAHRKRRERRQHFGDGADGVSMRGLRRGPRGCLMNMVDDATGTTCSRLEAKPSGQR